MGNTALSHPAPQRGRYVPREGTPATMYDTDYDTRREVLEQWEEQPGQNYVSARRAGKMLYAWANYVADETARVVEPDADEVAPEHKLRYLSLQIKETQRPAEDARGVLTVDPHWMVLTVEDVTSILVAAMGKEPDDTSYAGAGFTADSRHEGNVEIIREAWEERDG